LVLSCYSGILETVELFQLPSTIKNIIEMKSNYQDIVNIIEVISYAFNLYTFTNHRNQVINQNETERENLTINRTVTQKIIE
jgi:hypothetical protein